MNRRFDKRTDTGEHLSKLAALQQAGKPTRIDTFCGFELYLERVVFTNELVVDVRGKSSHQVSLGESDLGNITRIENVLKELPEVEKRLSQQIEQYEAQLTAAKEGLGKPFHRKRNYSASTPGSWN